MNETIAYYNSHAEEFCESTVNANMSDVRNRFLKYLPLGSRILDAGCGSGRDSLAFLEAGYEVDSFDAAESICEKAGLLLKRDVPCMTFTDVNRIGEYSGIWACASLLHLPKEDLPETLKILNRSLVKNGILYCSFKYGTVERETAGRFFTDLTCEELSALISKSGYDVLEIFKTEDVRENRTGQVWVNCIARKHYCDPSSEQSA